MPQPGMNGMEPAFGEAYGGHRGLLSPYPLAMSPQGGRAEYDQSVLLMLGSPASPRKRPFELLSDLVDDGGLAEDLHPERWDVSALDEMARYTKLGLGVGGELLACSEEAVLMGRWGRSREEEEEEEEEERRSRHVAQGVQATAAGREEGRTSAATTATGTGELCVAGRAAGGGGVQDGGVSRERTVEVYQVAQEEEEAAAAAAAGLTLEHCSSEEHNYSLSQGGELGAAPGHNPRPEETRRLFAAEVIKTTSSLQRGKKSPVSFLFCDTNRIGTLGPVAYIQLAFCKKGRRKARKTDASDLTPNPQKLHNIGEQLQKLNAAIDGMGPVNDLPAVARARSRKEKNKLASRACRLKKKAQHEANKIKLWGLNQEYENLLGALLRIKEVIRRRVESSEDEDADERGMTQRLEDILRESSGPLVAGRTKDFVQRILAASAGGQNQRKEPPQQGDETAG
ncbi:hypothetical protein F2P81_009696 [Scophthalmus maximus]|uniref:BZIP domain-containing protein n=1 Tax=Scophthalmus maximus TaxID=52904 RepID=A0A6A4T3S7_SCOMX|nr:hypothetical protein F2P81_009696 [Scophthalmus maximus]